MGAGDVMGGLAHGMLGLIGMGDAYNPMGDLSGELQTSISDMNNMVANNTILALNAISDDMQNFHELMEVKTKNVVAAQQVTNTQLFDSLQIENIFLIVLAVTVIIIVFFLLIQKKCC